MTGNMTLFVRDYVVFGSTCYALEPTMVSVRSWSDMEAIPQWRYESIMSKLLELKVGQVYDDDDMIDNPDGGIMTCELFFRQYGVVATGGRLLSMREIEEAIDDDGDDEWIGRRVVLDQRGPVLARVVVIDEMVLDLESEESFLDALDEVRIMNDVIGVWEEGSLDGTE